jgi:hypothetical protein
MRSLYKISFTAAMLLAVSIAAFSQSKHDEFFSSAEGGFKIKLAKTPTFTETKVNDLGSGVFYVWQDSKAQFVIQSMLFSSPVDNQFKSDFLRGFGEGLFNSSKATRLIDKDFSFKNNAGREFILLYEAKAKSIARGFYVGQRFFSVTATFFLDQPEVKESEIVATMNSFDLIPAKAKPKVK